MPALLRSAEETELWLTAPIGEALALQCPLPDGSLDIVERGTLRRPPGRTLTVRGFSAA